eukprot:c2865_g1_i1.p1 GENE.c2865_g1_i1~~c2865_g1_i1.p1  ORF type:complete len:312 (+),score=81.35 c2865_g1_i1:47-937(+)
MGDVYRSVPSIVPSVAPSLLSSVSRITIEMDITVAYIIFASLVEMIAAAKVCGEGPCSSYQQFAVALGSISFALGLIYGVALKFFTAPIATATPAFAFFFVVFWSIGVGIVTFKEPFTVIGNGYFASWLALLASMGFAYNTTKQFKGVVDWLRRQHESVGQQGKMLIAIAWLSLIELLAGAITYTNNTHHHHTDHINQTAYAIAAGAVSFAVCVLFLVFVPEQQQNHHQQQEMGVLQRVCGVFLVLWWSVCVGVTTFDAPFVYAGNGFFAGWLALLLSLYIQISASTIFGNRGTST